jgi:hypothetical protein
LSTAKGTACRQFSNVKNIAKPTRLTSTGVPRASPGRSSSPSARARAKGCVKATKGLIEKIEANPKSLLREHPQRRYRAGAIRGQLVVGMEG